MNAKENQILGKTVFTNNMQLEESGLLKKDVFHDNFQFYISKRAVSYTHLDVYKRQAPI